MISRLAHPSDQKLMQWLDGDATPATEHHVSVCERCAETLERLVGRLPDLRDALLAVLAPPAGYRERMAAAVQAQARARVETELLAGMFALPWQTSRLLLAGDAEEPRE